MDVRFDIRSRDRRSSTLGQRLASHAEMTLIATMVFRIISLFYSGGFWITNLWRKESNSYYWLQVCRAKSAVLTALRSEVNIGIWNLLTIAWRIVWRKHFFGTEIHCKWNFLDFDTPLPVFVFIIRFVYIFISSSQQFGCSWKESFHLGIMVHVEARWSMNLDDIA